MQMEWFALLCLVPKLKITETRKFPFGTNRVIFPPSLDRRQKDMPAENPMCAHTHTRTHTHTHTHTHRHQSCSSLSLCSSPFSHFCPFRVSCLLCICKTKMSNWIRIIDSSLSTTVTDLGDYFHAWQTLFSASLSTVIEHSGKSMLEPMGCNRAWQWLPLLIHSNNSYEESAPAFLL